MRNTINFVIPELKRLSEDEPYGVKGANVILKFSKLRESVKNRRKNKDQTFSKMRRGSILSACSTTSDQENINAIDEAETLGAFEICNDTVRLF